MRSRLLIVGLALAVLVLPGLAAGGGEPDAATPLARIDTSRDVEAALALVDEESLNDPRGTGYIVEIVDPFRMEIIDASRTSLGLIDEEVLADPRGFGFVVDLVATTETLEGEDLAVGIQEAETGTITLGGDVFFAFDEDTLTDSARSYLDQLAPTIRLRGEGIDEPVRIEGHTDNVGDPAYNQALSERRAASVRDYLVAEAGLGDLDFEVVGYGQDQPVALNQTADGEDDPAGRARNRRVEVRFASTAEDDPDPVADEPEPDDG